MAPLEVEAGGYGVKCSSVFARVGSTDNLSSPSNATAAASNSK